MEQRKFRAAWLHVALTALSIIGLCFCGVGQAFAQQGDDDATKETIQTGKPQKSFNGWDRVAGYNRTPILFDNVEVVAGTATTPAIKSRVYPPLEEDKLGRVYGSRDKKLTIYDPADALDLFRLPTETRILDVDDEIVATSLPRFTHIWKIKEDYLKDEFLRNKFLDNFTTLRGVAELTLQYLDPAVVAGLNAVAQQADQYAVQAQLKQISWAVNGEKDFTNKLIQRDVDYIVRECIAGGTLGAGQPRDDNGMGEGLLGSFDPSDCDPECGQPFGPAGFVPQNKAYPYQFCVCCAEKFANKPVPGNQGNPLEGGNFSLVDRVMGGKKSMMPLDAAASGPCGSVSSPLTPGTPVDYLCRVTKLTQFIKKFYGDVVRTDEGVHYLYPENTVAEKIRSFRDGCQGEGCSPSSCGPPGPPAFMVCPITGQYLKYGICPSLVWLMKVPDLDFVNYTPQSDLQDRWYEASLGYILSARDIVNLLKLHNARGSAIVESDPKWFPPSDSPLGIAVNAYCDAAAVATFSRLHIRLKSIVLDHMQANQFLSPYEKQRFMGLVQRVDGYLSLAEADANANWLAMQKITHLSIKRDRGDLATLGSTIAANINHQSNTTLFSSFESQFGGGTCVGPGC